MRSGIALLALIAAVSLVPGATAEDERPASAEATAGDLLDRALAAAELRKSDLFIPYDLVPADPFRRPVVDRLMEHPLEMPGYVRSLAAAMRGQESLLGLFQLALAQEQIDLGRSGRTFAIEGKIRYPEVGLEEIVRRVIVAARKVTGPDRETVLTGRGDLVEEALGVYIDDEDEETGDVLWYGEVRSFLDNAAAFDRAALARYAEGSLGHVELLATVLAALPAELLAKETTRTVEVEGLRVVIGGPGRDVHRGEFDVLIDLGGDDVYDEPKARGPFAAILDLGGDDLYRGERLAAGILGCSVLIDMAGDDVYRSGDNALGCGVLGLGVLDDRGGNDVYECGQVGQGAGILGWGLLVDRGGHDVYVSRGYGQAFAGVDGFGALVDHAGNDVYTCGGKEADPREEGVTQSMGQGFGFGLRPFASGGIALLLDVAGNDAYEGDYFAQGSSYWYALGGLVDLAGNDRYAARRYSGGAGIHLSVGVLVDEAGNDAYSMGFGVGLGCGHDWAHGILLDAAGNDSYQAGWLCLGAGNANGVGILCDLSGTDAYSMTRRSMAWGTWDKNRVAGSIGVFADGGGKDSYVEPGKDGSTWSQGKYGGGVDGEGGDPFPTIDLAKWLGGMRRRGAPTVGFFTRRMTEGMLESGPLVTAPKDFWKAVETLGRFEPGLEEAKKDARQRLRKLTEGEIEALVQCLGSPNIMVIIESDKALVAAGDAAIGPLVTAATKDDIDLAVRAIRTLGKIETEGAAKMLGAIMSHLLTSKDARVRRAGMSVAGKATGLATSSRGAIANWLDSKDVRDRAAAAKACGEIDVPWAEKKLRALLDDPHHLARFAAKAALEAKAKPKEEESR